MWHEFISRLRGFAADRQGATAILFGLVLMPLLIGIGVGVDYTRAQTLKKRLDHALDAAALAVGSIPGLEQAEMEARAQDFFDANFTPSMGAAEPLSLSVDGPRITVSATGHVRTVILGIIGIDEVDITAETEVTIAQRKIELAMVLDNTGSMAANGKIGALRHAARTMVDMLFEGESEQAEFVKVGLVPFAAAVNIGAGAPAAWIDTAALSPIAWEDFAPGVSTLDLYNEISNRAWNGCVRARVAPHDVQDTAPSPGNPATLWAPYFAPDEPDFSAYLNRYADDGDYGGSKYDYDKRQRYAGKYDGISVDNGNGPDFNCQTRPVTPLTNVKATLDAAIGGMNAVGSTVIPAGLAWGWRLVSPGAPFTQGAPYDDEDTIKAIVLLTDGRNDVGGGMGNHNRSFYSAYGYASSGHLGASNGGEAEEALNDKTETLCEAIKAQDIRIYTITFQLSNQSIKTLMRDCASLPSMYYDSPTNAELETVFEEIAKGLNRLRLSK